MKPLRGGISPPQREVNHALKEGRLSVQDLTVDIETTIQYRPKDEKREGLANIILDGAKENCIKKRSENIAIVKCLNDKAVFLQGTEDCHNGHGGVR